MNDKKIYISGLYSGPSPSAGPGIIRCLAAAFPGLALVGVDHWNGSSGLHLKELRERIVLPTWNELDFDLYRARVGRVLDEGSVWITSHDIEVDFLSRELGRHPRLLVPSSESFLQTAKPTQSVSELLPFSRPSQILFSREESDLYDFCREHSWRVWMKGPYHEAFPVSNWRELDLARRRMATQWPLDKLFLQAHVSGHEESICFSAFEGELLDVIRMEKRVTTVDGKTWAGRVLDVEPELLATIGSVVRKLEWHGGAEIELLRDADDRRWLMEWNPRFPAWIYGASHCGHNLPAGLVARALGMSVPELPEKTRSPREFTRVVVEVPVDPTFPLPLPKEPVGLVNAGKYGAGLTELAKTLLPKNGETARETTAVSSVLAKELARVSASSPASPQRHLMPEIARENFGRIADRARAASVGKVPLRPAYSFKTSPDPEYLSLAREKNFLAECISLLEVKRALSVGYSPSEIILNGPGKWWPQAESAPAGLRCLFADSLEEMTALVKNPALARTIGPRLRLPSITSRFGIAVGEYDVLERLAEALAKLSPDQKLGVHFHMASSAIGVTRWFDALESVLAWGRALEIETGRKITTLDLGGGWLLSDLDRVDFKSLVERAGDELTGLEEILIEPGKALTQGTQVLRSRVLDVRRRRGKVEEIVVDACIAELPLAAVYPHPIVWRDRQGHWQSLPYGSQRILGRICMEDDFLSGNIQLPEAIEIGDEIVFLEAGAYERTMAYEFGRGGY